MTTSTNRASGSQSPVWSALGAIAIAALLAGCGSGGGSGGGSTSGMLSVGPDEVLVTGVVVTPPGTPVPDADCKLEPLGPSPLHTSTAGLIDREAKTASGGRFAVKLPKAEVEGTYGGRFYRLHVGERPSADAPARIGVDMFVDVAGRDLGVLRVWPGDVRALRYGDEVEVLWHDLAETHPLMPEGYRVVLLGAQGEVLAEAIVTALATGYVFDAGALPSAPVQALVVANATAASDGGPAYMAFASEAVPVR